MNCAHCKRNIDTAAQKKMVIVYQYADGTEEYTVPYFNRTARPGGRLLRCLHFKCYMILTKRNSPSDAVARSRSAPTAYDMDPQSEDSREIVDHVRELRVQATAAGTGSQDWKLREQEVAARSSGPYPHEHAAEMPVARISVHLEHAHGVIVPRGSGFTQWRQIHGLEHVKLNAAKAAQARSEDPGHVPHRENDWRTQTVADIGPGGRLSDPE